MKLLFDQNIWIRTGNLTTNDIVKLMIQNRDVIERFLENDEYKDISCLEID